MKLRSDRSVKASEEQLAHLASRLTDRDRRIIRLVWDHRVLTTDQLRDLIFGATDPAQRRLLTLYRLGVLDRFRPLREKGSAPHHYVLGPMGAAVLAAERGIDPAQLGYRRDRTLAVAHNQRLAHIVGVNGFFAALAAAARRHPDTALAEWRSERDCAATWGRIVRPDGYGWWKQGRAEIDFFLEYDRGTETLARLAAKLDDYTDLVTATGVTTTWTLIWLPGPRREAHLRTLLSHPPILVATAHPIPNRTPADPVWLPAGPTHHQRQSLIALHRLVASACREVG